MLSCFPYLNPLYTLFSSPQSTTPSPPPSTLQQHPHSTDIQYSSLRPPSCPQNCKAMCPHLPIIRDETQVNGRPKENHMAVSVDGTKSDGEAEAAHQPRVFEVHDVDPSSVHVNTAKVSGDEVTTVDGEYSIQPDVQHGAGRKLMQKGDGKEVQEIGKTSVGQTHSDFILSRGKHGKVEDEDADADVDVDGLSSLIDENEDNNEEPLRLSIVDGDGQLGQENEGTLGHVFFF